MNKLFGFRRNYTSDLLNFNDLDPNPMVQFEKWFMEVSKNDTIEPNAMVLSTASRDGRPSVRYILLKGFDKTGFVFFTNYESRKGLDIKNNPLGALAFYWPNTQQQIRAEGKITLLNDDESDEYFNNRPQGSKIGAWASPQSKPIPNREYLENLKSEYEKKYQNFRVPRPKFWGGYKLHPDVVEFWQGRPDRLHDRFEYRLKDGLWRKERLAP
jgi:pyridoxamine 5'-phosphate oxidase